MLMLARPCNPVLGVSALLCRRHRQQAIPEHDCGKYSSQALVDVLDQDIRKLAPWAFGLLTRVEDPVGGDHSFFSVLLVFFSVFSVFLVFFCVF